MRHAGFALLSTMLLALAAASHGCGGVSTEGATASPTPGETEEPSPTEQPTATPTPAAGTKRVSVTFESVYVYDDSEPALTEPGEILFAVDVNGNYFETPTFEGADGAAYDLSLPTVDLDLGPDDVLFVSVAGFEDDPTGYDALGSLDQQFDASTGFGAGQHTSPAMFDPSTYGYFDVSFVIAVAE